MQSRVRKLRESASQDSIVVQQGLGKIQQEAVGANGRVNAFIVSADVTSLEDSAALDAKVSRMEEIRQSWYVNLRLFGYAGWNRAMMFDLS